MASVLWDLRVSMCGTDWPHHLGEVVDRPSGFTEYLFLRFRTPMRVQTARGLERCKVGSCLIYAPGHPHWYQGDGVGFRDDWCHVAGSQLEEALERAALPLNTLFMPRNTTFFPLLIKEIQSELQRKEALWQESVALATARILVLLGRGLREADDRESGVDLVRRGRLRGVREQVHERLSERWTVARMAKLAKLGENRFAVLYRETFGLSPVEDLIQARLNHACWLLTNSRRSISEAATLSGFASIHHFSRLFHRRVGCAPSDYYQSRIAPVSKLTAVEPRPRPTGLIPA